MVLVHLVKYFLYPFLGGIFVFVDRLLTHHLKDSIYYVVHFLARYKSVVVHIVKLEGPCKGRKGSVMDGGKSE